VDEVVRGAIETLGAAGAEVTEVSIPWHRDAVHLWAVIGTDGAFGQMLEGNGYGMNVPGLYDPELIAHFMRGRREHSTGMSITLTMTTLLGRYSLDRHGNQYYAMARNLALELTAAYDAAPASPRTLGREGGSAVWSAVGSPWPLARRTHG
jgi:amidase